VSAARAKGTRWESAIVDFLRDNGAPHAERRSLNGAKDRGDIAGVPGVVFEAKSAARLELAAWVDETQRERANDAAVYGVTIIKRRGKGSAGDGYAVLPFAALVALLREAGYIVDTDQRGAYLERLAVCDHNDVPALPGDTCGVCGADLSRLGALDK
jgi:hypothetical protein